MRFVQYLALSALFLFASASSAWAFGFEMTTTYMGAPYVEGSPVSVGDTVTVDIFFDADGGITILSVGLVNSDTSVLLYDGPASGNLTPHPSTATVGCVLGNCTGAQPSYVLYTGGRPPTALYPLNSPYFLNFPAPPGTEQMNMNYTEPAFNTTTATGTGIYIATLVLEVPVGASGTVDLSLEFTSSNIIQAGTFIAHDQSNPPPLIGAITVTVPEPALAGLALASLATLYLAHAYRRRAQR